MVDFPINVVLNSSRPVQNITRINNALANLERTANRVERSLANVSTAGGFATAIQSADRLEREYEELRRGVDRLTRDFNEQSSVIQRQAAEIQRLTTAQNNYTGATQRSTQANVQFGRGTRPLRAQVQNTAFQIQDIAVQLQAGTALAIVLGQQLPQLAGGFGAWGAAIGAVLAVAIPLGAVALPSLFGGASDLEEISQELAETTDRLRTAFSGLTQPIIELQDTYSGTTVQVSNLVAALAELESQQALQSTQTFRNIILNNDLIDVFNQANNVTDVFNDRSAALARRLGLTGDQVEQAVEAFRNLNNAINDEERNRAITELSNLFVNLGVSLDGNFDVVIGDFRQLQREIEGLNRILQENISQAGLTSEQYNELQDEITDLIGAQGFSGIADAASAFRLEAERLGVDLGELNAQLINLEASARRAQAAFQGPLNAIRAFGASVEENLQRTQIAFEFFNQPVGEAVAIATARIDSEIARLNDQLQTNTSLSANQRIEIQNNIAAIEDQRAGIIANVRAEAQLQQALEARNTGLSESNRLTNLASQQVLPAYLAQLSDLNALLQMGAISQQAFNLQVQQLQLPSDLRQLDRDLAAGAGDTRRLFELQQEEIRLQQEERLLLIQAGLEAELLSEQEAADRRVRIRADADRQITDLIFENQRIQLATFSTGFDQLASAIAGFAGEQSAAYRILFATSKAFAIAESLVAIQQAAAKALAAGTFPFNLAFVATVLTQGASIIASLQAVSATFAEGGFVSGPGGPTSDSIPARLSNGEFVVNATATARHRELLESINSGRGFQIGGLVGPRSVPTPTGRAGLAGPSITIIQEPGVFVEPEMVTEDQVTLIARREASRTMTDNFGRELQNQLRNPNSEGSRSLERNTRAGRRRNG